MGHYILKKGCKHSCIVKGEHVSVVGDGVGTVELSEDQAANFKDKLVSKSDEEVAFAVIPKSEAVAASSEDAAETVKEEKSATAPVAGQVKK
jgi:hypothetical protein